MDEHTVATAHDAIQVRDVGSDPVPLDAPYAGQPGQTRYENVHLVEPDGSLRAAPVCRCINTQTHPELKPRALSGNLHRLEDGRELALSFVYHDPVARKFALVLPATLAHLELKEWSRLMAEIADDTRQPVPRYVRDCTTILGLDALERFALADPEALDSEVAVVPADGFRDRPTRDSVRPPPGDDRETLLLQRERELAEQERALIRMAEGLTTREGELQRMREEIDTARVDLEIREGELLDHGQRENVRSNWTEVGLRGSKELVNETTRENLIASGDARATLSREAVALRTHPPPLPQRSRSGPPPLPARRIGPPPLAARRELEEVRQVALRSSAPPPLPGHALVTPHNDTDAQPEVGPPPYFAGQRAGQMALKLVADELWLFVHLEEVHAAAFRRGVDVMLQYAQVEDYPVFVLSLLSQNQEQPQAIRLALDGRSEADLRVLEHLSRSFRARVALYIGGIYCETLTATTLREAVAQAISDKLGKLPKEAPRLSSADAMMRVLHAPPPLQNDDLPFGPVRREASSPAMVQAALEQLQSWLKPEKLEEATLVYSVPRHVVEATIRRVLRAAVAFGVALPEELTGLAIEHGAAPDRAALAQEQLNAFRQRVEQGKNDLGGSATRKNWERLLAEAEAHDVSIDDATRALAAAKHGPSQRPDPTRPLRPFEGLSAAELRTKLQVDAEREEAICEFCVRGHASAVEPVLAALPQVSEAGLPRCIAHLMMFGDAAGDGLIAALTSPTGALRQMAALALGRLRLRRALMPMVRQLEAEDSPIHTEIARAFGDFGSGSLRMLVRAIPGSSASERLVLALAHLANHGSAKDVEKLENDPDSEVAHAARKAMARRSRMEWEDLAVRGQRTLDDADAATLLSQAFYAELAKVAI